VYIFADLCIFNTAEKGIIHNYSTVILGENHLKVYSTVFLHATAMAFFFIRLWKLWKTKLWKVVEEDRWWINGYFL